MGCAIACVAFAVTDSYKNAKKLFVHPEHAIKRGYYNNSIVKALRNGGLRYSFERANGKNELISREGSIIFIGIDERYPYGHYLINTELGWMDSWVNVPVIPRESGFRKELPGTAEWIIYKVY